VSNLMQRIGIAVVFVPILVALFWYGGIYLLFALGVIVAIGIREFCHMLQAKALSPWTPLAMVIGLLWVGVVFVYGLEAWPIFFSVVFLLLLMIALFKGEPGWRLANAGGSLLAILYVAFLASFVILVRHYPMSQSHIFALMILGGIWISDTAAYFAGRLFGRWHPFPKISPGKTEAGFVGGIFAAVATIVWTAQTWDLLSLEQGVVLGIVVGVGAPVGDLVESMIKRDMGVKDTSELIPGHGGMLDRFDSVFFVFPLAYLFLKIVNPV